MSEIVTGELIGHRLWYWDLRLDQLRSITMNCTWKPHEPMTGDISLPLPLYGTRAGVFSFQNQQALESKMIQPHRPWFTERPWPVLVGTVWLWGRIAVHENGYRASFAAVRSIDRSLRGCDIDVVDRARRTYLTGESP